MRWQRCTSLALLSTLAATSCGLALDNAQPGTTTTTLVSPAPPIAAPSAPATTLSTDALPLGSTTIAPESPPPDTTDTVPTPQWCDQYVLFTTKGTDLLDATGVDQMAAGADDMIAALESVETQSTGEMRDATPPLLAVVRAFRDSIDQVTTVDDGFDVLRDLVEDAGPSIQRAVSLGGATCTGRTGTPDFDLIPG